MSPLSLMQYLNSLFLGVTKSGFSIQSNFSSKILLGFAKAGFGKRQKNPLKAEAQRYFFSLLFKNFSLLILSIIPHF